MYITLVKPKLQERIRSAEYKIGLARHLFELQLFFFLKATTARARHQRWQHALALDALHSFNAW
jgi:hypothetical protein